MPAKQHDLGDGRIVLAGKWGQAKYEVRTKARLPKEALPLIIHTAGNIIAGPKFLLLSDYINQNAANELRCSNVEFVDAVGNIFLKQPSFYIFITGLKPETNVVERGAKWLTPAGLKLVFLLLKRPVAVNWTHRALSEEAGVSLGYIGDIMESLRERGYLRLAGPDKQVLINKEDLLFKWEEGYISRLRPKLLQGRYSVSAGKTPQDLLPLIRDYSDNKVIVGGEVGASLLTGEIRPEKATLYIAETASRVMSMLRLRPDPDGNVTLLRAFGRQNGWNNNEIDGITVADPLLVHAEMMLLNGERIRGVAERIYNDYLLMRDKHDKS
ncbi:MAG: type IV toxin-antitoxin system AbiEi family antitoxin [bacterium]|nr:type IV toxin-antitoxin system AbiEi family antitoxin [bacterium]